MNTRPTTDRNKENIFNVIGPYFDGGTSLDMFGGSGSLTIESVSRGIEKAVIIDKHPHAINIIKKNVEMLKIQDRVDIIRGDYLDIMTTLAKQGKKFDLILIDPPFKMLVIDEIVSFVDEHDLLTDDGIIMAEYFKDNKFDAEFDTIECTRFLDYGTSHIKIYRKKD
jgi:16S rRNA (guanine(966)-N(2))-methyltransferase RsmD